MIIRLIGAANLEHFFPRLEKLATTSHNKVTVLISTVALARNDNPKGISLLLQLLQRENLNSHLPIIYSLAVIKNLKVVPYLVEHLFSNEKYIYEEDPSIIIHLSAEAAITLFYMLEGFPDPKRIRRHHEPLSEAYLDACRKWLKSNTDLIIDERHYLIKRQESRKSKRK